MYVFKLKSISLLSVITLFIVSFAGCTRQSDKNKFGSGSINQESFSESNAAKLAAAGKKGDAAEEYARIGEQLLIPGAIEYADQMFDKALALDINNRRANLYSALTKPVMSFKGFIPRFQKLVDANSVEPYEVWNLYSKLQREIEKVKLPELRRLSFELPAGTAPFGSYFEFQRFLRTAFMPAMLDSEIKLERLMNGAEIELYIDFNRAWQKSDTGGYTTNSTCVRNAKGEWSCNMPQKVNSQTSKNIKVDPVDIKVLKGSLMAVVDFTRLKTAYNISGSDAAIKEIDALDKRRKEQGKKLSTRDVVRTLNKYSDLFTLADDNQLSELANSTEQVLRHALDLHTMRNEVCDNPLRMGSSRLFPTLCVGLEAVDRIELTLDLLAGPEEILLGNNEYGEPVTLWVDVTPILKNSPKDLKDLLPTEFNYKGEPVSFPDPTMGGLFPDGDFFEKFKGVKKDKGLSFTKVNKAEVEPPQVK